MPPLNLSESVEVNSMKWCQEALAEHACPVSVCSSSFLPPEKLGDASVHCLELRANQKCTVSPVWGMSFPRNLEFLMCGRALNNCRNSSLATDHTPVCLFLQKEGRASCLDAVCHVALGVQVQCSGVWLHEMVTPHCSSFPPDDVKSMQFVAV